MSRYDPELGWVRSALTLRLWLAGFGLVVCVVGAVLCFAAAGPVWLAVVLVVLAVVAAVDMVVLVRRKLHGEPG